MLLKARDDVLEFLPNFNKDDYPLLYEALELFDTEG